MKANRKFKEADEAVSAVIGVILMVAITVAIAATVYVYVSGMIGTGQTATPNVQFTKGSRTLTVARADTGLSWADFTVSSNQTINTLSGAITAGQVITVSGTAKAYVTIIHKSTNSLLGNWSFV
jgi:flagellin-like protein